MTGKKKRGIRKWIRIFRRKRKGRRTSKRRKNTGRNIKYACYFKGWLLISSLV
jgi:hypothetical protein